MKTIEEINQHNVKQILADKKIPEFFPGDVVKVGVRITEGKKDRVQYFEGVCIAKKNRDINSSFTVRKISFGEGVERTFPLYGTLIDTITVIRSGKVRRAKLYYLRELTGKKARIVERIRAKQPDLASQFTYEEEIEYLEETPAEENASEKTVAVEADASNESSAQDEPAQETTEEKSKDQ